MSLLTYIWRLTRDNENPQQTIRYSQSFETTSQFDLLIINGKEVIILG